VKLQVGPARAEERADAFRLFFQRIAEEELPGRVDRGLELIASGQVAGDGVIVCREGHRLVGVMVAMPLQGAAALVWPPQAQAGLRETEIEDRLVEFTVAWMRQQGCKIAQALLPPGDLGPALPLERHGFTSITTLHYLEKAVTAEALDAAPQRLSYRPYSTEEAELFQSTLLQSYHGGLDCPELNQVRTAEEVLAGYQAVPGCRLDRWWLACDAAGPVGVLIVVEMQGMPVWELLYLGLVPQARGRGWGTEMTRQVLAQAWTAGAERLTLTVDSRNAPALRMYAALEFEEFDRRVVFLNIFAKG
jgi:mycothiol synthase